MASREGRGGGRALEDGRNSERGLTGKEAARRGQERDNLQDVTRSESPRGHSISHSVTASERAASGGQLQVGDAIP